MCRPSRRARTQSVTWWSFLPADGPFDLEAALEESRRLGLLGPGPVATHLWHAQAFVTAWAQVGVDPPTLVIDLGTGGGVPGLVLAVTWPSTRFVLIDGSQRRIAVVAEAIARLGLGPRVTTMAARAEVAAASLRGVADLVVARGFGPPAVTAECAAPLLRVGGWLAVSEPPERNPGRWPSAGLETLGLGLGPVVEDPAHVQLLHALQACPERFPRRTGIPGKRPLWTAR